VAGRIDTHQHVCPPDYRQWLIDQGVSAGGLPIPEWSVENALSMMDKLRVATGILSISTPGVHLTGDDLSPAPVARSWARRVNESSAEVVRNHPGRFGFLATLTLPDVDGALEEAAYALDVLGADGVALLANTHGRYLGDPAFDPLFDELGRRGAVVFVHPSELPAPPVDGVPPYVMDFLLDTTRAAYKLVASGTLDRNPDLKVILSHAGGFLPYASFRMAPFANPTDPLKGFNDMRRFYFDLALSSTPAAMPALLAFADPTHITYGSDSPYAPAQGIETLAAMLDRFDLSDEQRAAVDCLNAERLFPRLGQSVGNQG
jgi:predicted TIM-barrel fold metal-dependent hydrolase